MATFPQLKTGAVGQYPFTTKSFFRTEIVSFVDGAEQRFRHYPSVLRVWEIRLNRLDDRELAEIEAFFVSNQGGTLPFSFTDPVTDQVFPSCSLDSPAIAMNFAKHLAGSTSLVIRQNRI